MSGPVIAIAFDSGDREMCQEWVDAGYMPNLARLTDEGAYVPINNNLPHHVAEVPWTTLFTGVHPDKSGFWTQLKFRPDNYKLQEGGYDYKEFPPFFALGDDYRVAAIDIPQCKITDGFNGVYLQAWGAHSPYGKKASVPPEFFNEVVEKYGPHPAHPNDHARLWWRWQMRQLADRLSAGARRRADIITDLLRDQKFDLVLSVFSELHSAGHYLYHVSQADHPLHETYKNACNGDPLVQVAKAVDDALGAVMAAAPEGSTFVVFSQEGMCANNLDLPSMVFLPELMYRYSFPGKYGFRGGPPGTNEPPAPVITDPRSIGWVRGAWALKHDDNKLRGFLRRHMPMEFSRYMGKLFGEPEGIGYPYEFQPYWQSPNWFSPHWKEMKAFGLPSFSDGYVRVNLKGRDAHGVVEPEDYDRVCDEIVEIIDTLRCARTGKKVAKKIMRTRKSADDDDPRYTDGDIVVCWDQEMTPVDVVDSPKLGRIGPMPHRRSGGHTTKCFAIVNGPGIEKTRWTSEHDLLDVPPTILSLLGAPIPPHLDGRPLFGRAAAKTSVAAE